MWEIMSFADIPYASWSNIQTMSEIDKGYRLEAPPNCPTSLYQIMLSCWSSDPKGRPGFDQIFDFVKRFYEEEKNPHPNSGEKTPIQPNQAKDFYIEVSRS